VLNVRSDYTCPCIKSIDVVPIDEIVEPTDGGWRIYPGKTKPKDPTDNSLLTVQASAPPGSTVYFRSFDIDDPSTDDVEVDSTGPDGWDNRGTPQEGDLLQDEVIAGSDGIAETLFRVTKHPGDNFRIAAGCDQEFMDLIYVDGTELIGPDGSPISSNSESVQATLPITVWRKLHIELDKMGSVNGNVTSGTIKSKRCSKKTSLCKLKLNLTSILVKRRYEGGQITIQGTPFLVVENGRDFVETYGDPGKVENLPFELVDDDNFDGDENKGDEGQEIVPTPDTFSLMQKTDEPAHNIFAPAYIMPVIDGGGDPTWNNMVPFLLHVLPDVLDTQIETYRDSKGNESDDFWVSYLQLSYQGVADNDPNLTRYSRGLNEFGGTGGVTIHTGVGSLLFMETMRDVDANFVIDNKCPVGAEPFMEIGVAPHEIGHQFGLGGDDSCNSKSGAQFGIMSYGVPREDLKFVPLHLDALRSRVKSPGE